MPPPASPFWRGIGANTSIFSVVYAVILKPLPYPNATRLVFVWEKLPFMPEPIGPRIQVQRVAYLEWQRQSNTFADMAAFQVAPLNEAGVDRPRSISTGFTSANLFPLDQGPARVAFRRNPRRAVVGPHRE